MQLMEMLSSLWTKKQKKLKNALKPSQQKTRICRVCFKNIEEDSLHSILFKNATICRKCFLNFNPVLQRFQVGKIKVEYLYNYDEIIKEKLYIFKGCYDYELAPIFIEYFLPYLRMKYFDYILVPAPSWHEADEERGFNHIEAIFSSLKLPMQKCVHKIQNIKQSDLSKFDREKIRENLCIVEPNLYNKKVLIVDDVFTTGSTVKAMIDLIEKEKPKKLKVLVLSKTLNENENNY